MFILFMVIDLTQIKHNQQEYFDTTKKYYLKYNSNKSIIFANALLFLESSLYYRILVVRSVRLHVFQQNIVFLVIFSF